MLLDLDHFKRVNDSLGHAVGDELLRTIASRLRETLPETATLARLGGDEFVILAGHLDDEAAASALAERILAAVAQRATLEGTDLTVTFSLGIALYSAESSSPELLMKQADAAMYQAKRDGRNRFAFYSRNLDRASGTRLRLEHDLRLGLEREEFRLHYQPLVDTISHRTVGVEALARWARPGYPLQSPGEFIEPAEENGLILPIGAQLLREACRQLAQWEGTGHAALRMSVNVSMVQVASPDFVTTVRTLLTEHGIPGARLQIELTESTLMRNPEITRSVLRRLKDLNINIAIDDFGTGYSSLSYLRGFPVDTVKIDRSFIADIEHDPEDRKLVRAILAMSRVLRLEVIAEGVETQRQADILGALGCPLLQGYLFARPAPAADLEAWLMRDASRPVAARLT